MPFYSRSLLLCLVASTAFAASSPTDTVNPQAPTPAEGMKLVASMKSWDDALASFKVMPTNVQKEMAAVVKDQDFPDVRYIKAGLVIRQSDGHLIKMVFGKHGKAFINGKPWRLNPLAKPADEVARIAKLAGERTAAAKVLDRLIPSAEAAGFPGAAALAYSSSTSWKAQSCAADEEYSDEQTHDCPLMGVAFNIVDPVRSRNSTQIGLKCPPNISNGDLVMITKSSSDLSSGKTTVSYVSGKPAVVNLKAFNKSGGLDKEIEVDLRSETDPKRITFAQNLANLVEPQRQDVCGGDLQAKRSFTSKLDSNRAQFSSASSTSDADGQTSMQ